MLKVLFLFTSLAASCNCFLIIKPHQTTSQLFSTTLANSEALKSSLKKPSNTLAVVLEYDGPDDNVGRLTTLSMQLRKLKAAAIATSSVAVAKAFVEEQATAQGNFPCPCPVIYTGNDMVDAIKTGVSAVVASERVDGVDTLIRVTSTDQISTMETSAFLVDGSADNVKEILKAIPSGSVIVASVKAMQQGNSELELSRTLKELGVTAILLEKACVGDNEDIEYSMFAVDGLTKKKSSTFNMSGLTGSTNGHFGGVASSIATTWLRTKQ